MPAVLHPVPPPPLELEIRASVDATPRYVVLCDKCRWAPEWDGPLDEAAARIAAYEHNAHRHPEAVVEVLSYGQIHARTTRELRKEYKILVAMAVFVGLVQAVMLIGVGTPWFTILTVLMWTGLGVTRGIMIGRLQFRLREHQGHPPGSFGVILSPPEDPTDEEMT